jgi:hypothetical protein
MNKKVIAAAKTAISGLVVSSYTKTEYCINAFEPLVARLGNLKNS